MKIKITNSDKAFDVVNYILLTMVMFIVAFPLWFVIVASFSDPTMVARGRVLLWPRNFTVDMYRLIMENSAIWTGYKNTVIYTLAGTSLNLFVTFTCAYTLSKKTLPFRQTINFYFLFTMYFSGGMIPTFLLIRDLGLIDNRMVMILPGAMSVYLMVITRTYFMNSIPEELYEAARIDGQSDIGMFLKIAIPLAKPIIAVMALFYGVGHWNAFYGALIYLRNRSLYPLQIILRSILIQNQEMFINPDSMLSYSLEEVEHMARMVHIAGGMKYALVFVACAPVLIVYPFLQRFFVKGIMVGALKA